MFREVIPVGGQIFSLEIPSAPKTVHYTGAFLPSLDWEIGIRSSKTEPENSIFGTTSGRAGIAAIVVDSAAGKRFHKGKPGFHSFLPKLLMLSKEFQS